MRFGSYDSLSNFACVMYRSDRLRLLTYLTFDSSLSDNMRVRTVYLL